MGLSWLYTAACKGEQEGSQKLAAVDSQVLKHGCACCAAACCAVGIVRGQIKASACSASEAMPQMDGGAGFRAEGLPGEAQARLQLQEVWLHQEVLRVL